jgi:Phosphotransferase enzyme family
MTGQVALAIYRKQYRDQGARRLAEANYRWLTGLGGPLRLPRLTEAADLSLSFEHVDGRHAQPSDLVLLARHLGDVHGGAYSRELAGADLRIPFPTAEGHVLPAFPQRRLDAVARELATRAVPGAVLTTSQAQRLITSANGPAALYKDANPRNFLITGSGPVTIDFDELTLAPLGYDLAKLIVTLAMTHGELPGSLIAEALAGYNAAARERGLGITRVAWGQLMAWAEIHHILTCRYRGNGTYLHSWDKVRPVSPLTTGRPTWR